MTSLVCCSKVSKTETGVPGGYPSGAPIITTDTIRIDDSYFRLYYRYTGLLLLIISVSIVVREWFTNPLDCMPYSSIEQNQITAERLNTYCRLHNRFLSIVDYDYQSSKMMINQDINNVTIMDVDRLMNQYGEQMRRTPKYKWFSFILMTFASLIYVPHLIWKHSNRKMILDLVQQINYHHWCRPSQGSASGVEHNFELVAKIVSLTSNRYYFAKSYIVLKLCNVAILLIILHFTQTMLQQNFYRLPFDFYQKMIGNDLVEFRVQQQALTVVQLKTSLISSNYSQEQQQRSNRFLISNDIFPKISLCPYSYESSIIPDTEQISLVKCLMPINFLLEQCFVALWIWYYFVMFFTVFDFLRYTLMLLIRPMRKYHLQYYTNNLLDVDLYQKLSRSFSSWLFANIVLINNDAFLNQIKFDQNNIIELQRLEPTTTTTNPITSNDQS